MKLIAVLLFFISLPAWAAPKIHEDYFLGENLKVDGENYPSAYLRHPQPLAEEWTLETFLAVLKNKQIHTIEDAIALLPWQMREDNYVVMYRSRSLQVATPQSPRVLIYTPTARFILAFNGGEAGVKGSDSLEIIQFRDASASFEFRELVFDGEKAPTVSQANPKKCLECHQGSERKNIDLRPNWEPYNLWPGAIGSVDGHLKLFLLKNNPVFFAGKTQPQDRPFVEEQFFEKDIAQNFVKEIAPMHPRYRHLGGLNVHAPSDLTNQLGVLNFMRVVRLMSAEADVYENHQELLALVAVCRDAEVIEGLLSRHREQPIPAFFSYGLNSGLSQWVTWMFEGLGISTADWSMDFGTRGRLAAFERFGTPGKPESLFAYAWRKTAPRAKELEKLGCAALQAAAKTKIEKYFARTDVQAALEALKQREPKDGAQVVARCLKCHDGTSALAPEIDFKSPHQLGAGRLEKIAYRTSDMATRDEQMPPEGRLSPEERLALLKYLKPQ